MGKYFEPWHFVIVVFGRLDNLNIIFKVLNVNTGIKVLLLKCREEFCCKDAAFALQFVTENLHFLIVWKLLLNYLKCT